MVERSHPSQSRPAVLDKPRPLDKERQLGGPSLHISARVLLGGEYLDPSKLAPLTSGSLQALPDIPSSALGMLHAHWMEERKGVTYSVKKWANAAAKETVALFEKHQRNPASRNALQDAFSALGIKVDVKAGEPLSAQKPRLAETFAGSFFIEYCGTTPDQGMMRLARSLVEGLSRNYSFDTPGAYASLTDNVRNTSHLMSDWFTKFFGHSDLQEAFNLCIEAQLAKMAGKFDGTPEEVIKTLGDMTPEESTHLGTFMSGRKSQALAYHVSVVAPALPSRPSPVESGIATAGDRPTNGDEDPDDEEDDAHTNPSHPVPDPSDSDTSGVFGPPPERLEGVDLFDGPLPNMGSSQALRTPYALFTDVETRADPRLIPKTVRPYLDARYQILNLISLVREHVIPTADFLNTQARTLGISARDLYLSAQRLAAQDIAGNSTSIDEWLLTTPAMKAMGGDLSLLGQVQSEATNLVTAQVTNALQELGVLKGDQRVVPDETTALLPQDIIHHIIEQIQLAYNAQPDFPKVEDSYAEYWERIVSAAPTFSDQLYALLQLTDLQNRSRIIAARQGSTPLTTKWGSFINQAQQGLSRFLPSGVWGNGRRTQPPAWSRWEDPFTRDRFLN